MRKLILMILILIVINACAPFSGIDSCVDIEGKGSKCGAVTDNLIDLENREQFDNSSLILDNISTDDAVYKDELVRLMTTMSIDSNTTKAPTIIMPATYRMLILPYTNKTKLYSSRYVYFTAGKSRWISGDYIISDNAAVKIDVPANINKHAKTIVEIDDRLPIAKQSVSNRYYVDTDNGLNCRNKPSTNAAILATYENGKELNVIDDTTDRWFKTDMYGVKCYVDSRYLKTENDK